MDNDQFIVCRAVYIYLQRIHALLNRLAKCQECVFRKL
jgi:hypothetical protein